MPKEQPKHEDVSFLTGITSMQQPSCCLMTECLLKYPRKLHDIHHDLVFPLDLLHFWIMFKVSGSSPSQSCTVYIELICNITCDVLSKAAWAHDVFLQCCGYSSARDINSSIYPGSGGCCPLIQKVPTNKQKQNPEWVKWWFCDCLKN